MAQHLSLTEALAERRREEPDIWLVSDETDTVQVSVDVHGKLETLRLAPSWWRRVSPEELGSVVFRARQASAATRFHTISELEEEGVVVDIEGQAAEGSPEPATPKDAASLDMAQLGRRLEDLLTAFSDLDRYRRAVGTATTEGTTLTSPSGNASLELVGGSPRRLTIDRLNIQFTPERDLAAEIVDLFARADHWLAERQQTVLDELPALADVVRSVRDR